MAAPCYGPLLLWDGPEKQLSCPPLPAIKLHFLEPTHIPLCRAQVLTAGLGRACGLKATHVPGDERWWSCSQPVPAPSSLPDPHRRVAQ